MSYARDNDPWTIGSRLSKYCNGDNCNNKPYVKSSAARIENISFGLISTIISISAAAYWNR